MRDRSRFVLAPLLAVSGCFFNPASCVPLPNLPDGSFTDIPDAAGIEYAEIVGDPGEILDGGTTIYGPLSITTTFDGGQRIETVTMGSVVFETVVYQVGDDTDVVATTDVNLDGVIDVWYTSLYDGTSTVTSTTLSDTNFDGVVDTQDIWSVDVSTTPYTKTETVSQYLDSDGGFAAADAGSWVQAWTFTGPAEANSMMSAAGELQDIALADCDGQEGFPPHTLSGAVQVPNTNIYILVGDPTQGYCDPTEAAKIDGAMSNAILDMANCLGTANPGVGYLLKGALSTRTLFVACGNTCDQVLASTDLPYASSSQSDESNGRINAGGFQQMNLGRPFVDNDSIVQIQEYVGHELLHFAGLDHSPPGSGDPAGHDRVYGCGRYCTQCLSGFVTAGWTSQPGPAQYAYDCADCADSARQSVCGAMAEVLTQCSPQICGLPQNTNTAQCVGTGSVCCATTVDNCWANMTADLAGRDITLNTIAGMQYGDCIEVGTTNSCMTSMTCTPGTFPMPAVPNPMADCFHWPVGFCAGPGME